MRLVVVLKGYPRLSETFVAQELLALEERGFELILVSLRHPTDPVSHPVHAAIRASVVYLPEYLHQEPLRLLQALRRTVRQRALRGLLRTWLADLRRDPTRNRVRRLGQALVLASEVVRPGDRLYAHFIHTPGSVARYAALLTGVPLALSAHAKDIWTLSDREKREKLDDADFTVTCTAANLAHLRRLASRPERVHLVYHGLDASRFPPPPIRAPRNGSDPNDPVRLLTVARAVPKKGMDLLLDALALLPTGLAWHFTHIGGGDVAPLRTRARSLGLEDRITWRGALAQPDVIEAYRAADLAVLASRITPDGDRDGLPNVLLEAASQGVPSLATDVSAIPELITHGVDGWLVPPEDASALAEALGMLITRPALRGRLGACADATVRGRFTARLGIDRLAALFRDEHLADAA